MWYIRTRIQLKKVVGTLFWHTCMAMKSCKLVAILAGHSPPPCQKADRDPARKLQLQAY